MSLETEIQDSRISRHYERLFVTGSGLLITESTMIQSPNEVLTIMKWYKEISKKKFGTWKLFLRPNVKYWLERQAVASSDKKSRYDSRLRSAFVKCQFISSYLDMLTVVRDMTRKQSPAYYICDSDQSEAEAYEGNDEERGRAGVLVSPGCLSGYPSMSSTTDFAELEKLDAVLLEHFAAWACLHAHNLRRFTAVSPFSRSEWDRWGHVSRALFLKNFAPTLTSTGRLRYLMSAITCRTTRFESRQRMEPLSHESGLRWL